MKKLIAGLALTAALTVTAAPALAATQWNFGASLRYGTFWTERDFGSYKRPDLQQGGARVNNDSLLSWGTQANSTIEMFMRSDNLEGYIEMEYDVDGNTVTTSQYWGRYRFGNGFNVTIGQQHQLFSQFISNQAWGDDLNMNSIGTAYAAPTPKITLGYGGFSLALSKPDTGRFEGYRWNTNTYLPQLQAAYAYSADTWRVKLAGAYQHTKLNKRDQTYYPGQRINENLHSWLVAADGDINFGLLYLALAAAVGQNWSDAGWNDENSGLDGLWSNGELYWWGGSQFSINAGGRMKAEDTTSFMLSAVAAYRLTEALRLEAGAGFRYDDNDLCHNSQNIWNMYLQAAYTVAPGFTVTPEIGYIDFGRWTTNKADPKGKDFGYLWYAGAKWQMDF